MLFYLPLDSAGDGGAWVHERGDGATWWWWELCGCSAAPRLLQVGETGTIMVLLWKVAWWEMFFQAFLSCHRCRRRLWALLMNAVVMSLHAPDGLRNWMLLLSSTAAPQMVTGAWCLPVNHHVHHCFHIPTELVDSSTSLLYRLTSVMDKLIWGWAEVNK